MKQRQLSFGAKCLWARLYSYRNFAKTCPGHKKLGEELGICVRQVRTYLMELRQFGLIDWKRTQKSSEYFVYPPEAFRPLKIVPKSGPAESCHSERQKAADNKKLSKASGKSENSGAPPPASGLRAGAMKRKGLAREKKKNAIGAATNQTRKGLVPNISAHQDAYARFEMISGGNLNADGRERIEAARLDFGFSDAQLEYVFVFASGLKQAGGFVELAEAFARKTEHVKMPQCAKCGDSGRAWPPLPKRALTKAATDRKVTSEWPFCECAAGATAERTAADAAAKRRYAPEDLWKQSLSWGKTAGMVWSEAELEEAWRIFRFEYTEDEQIRHVNGIAERYKNGEYDRPEHVHTLINYTRGRQFTCPLRKPVPPEKKPSVSNPLFGAEELREHLLKCALGYGRFPQLGQHAQRVAILAHHAEAQIANLDALEKALTSIEDYVVSTLLASMGPAVITSMKEALAKELAPYRGKMTAEQLAMLERRYFDTAVLERQGVPRLSLFYLHSAGGGS